MRRTILIPALVPVLVLAACGENSGWNPNYRANATPYGDYLRTRESALMGRRGEPPRIVPVTLPVKAPTPEQIAGHSLRPVPEATLAKVRRPAGAPRLDAAPRRARPLPRCPTRWQKEPLGPHSARAPGAGRAASAWRVRRWMAAAPWPRWWP